MKQKKEKYLSIKLAGHNFVNAFFNKEYGSKPNLPMFKGNGIAVWVHEVKPKIDESIISEDFFGI